MNQEPVQPQSIGSTQPRLESATVPHLTLFQRLKSSSWTYLIFSFVVYIVPLIAINIQRQSAHVGIWHGSLITALISSIFIDPKAYIIGGSALINQFLISILALGVTSVLSLVILLFAPKLGRWKVFSALGLVIIVWPILSSLIFWPFDWLESRRDNIALEKHQLEQDNAIYQDIKLKVVDEKLVPRADYDLDMKDSSPAVDSGVKAIRFDVEFNAPVSGSYSFDAGLYKKIKDDTYDLMTDAPAYKIGTETLVNHLPDGVALKKGAQKLSFIFNPEANFSVASPSTTGQVDHNLVTEGEPFIFQLALDDITPDQKNGKPGTDNFNVTSSTNGKEIDYQGHLSDQSSNVHDSTFPQAREFRDVIQYMTKPYKLTDFTTM